MQTNIQQIADAIIPQQVKSQKCHLVMMFFSASELGIPAEVAGNMAWLNTRNLYFDNITKALDCYANTRCSASQLISADTPEELEMKKQRMLDNFSNAEWLNKNLYPYL